MESLTIDSLEITPLTPDLMDSMGTVLRGSWGSTCWCMYPRWTEPQMREEAAGGERGPRRREAMTELATRQPAPGLLAFEGDHPWVGLPLLRGVSSRE